MEEDVLGLDVAVDHAVAVRVVQRVGDVGRDAHRLVDAQLLLAIELGAQRLALDVGHHVVQEAIGGAGVEQGQDVGVLERGGGLDLLDEPVGTEHRGQLGPEHLDGDLAVVLEVGGQIDGGHAPLAQLPFEAVAVGQGGGEAVEGHRSPAAVNKTDE